MRFKKILIGAAIIAAVFALLAVVVAKSCVVRTADVFAAMQAESAKHAGTWEDDPQNWFRAFHEQPPSGVTVVHSKYWRSNHFTLEYACYFEVQATPGWRDAFLQKRKLQPVPPGEAWSFNKNSNASMTPAWFAADPLEAYEVWDIAGYHGSVWIRKSDGHIFFWEVQL